MFLLAYHALITLGKPFGGIRPRRLYDILGRRAYPTPEYAWMTNTWGTQLHLSHHFHLDRNTLIFGEYDPQMHRIIQARVKPGMIALDIGANLGEMTLHMAQLVGDTGQIYAFEPFPIAHARLLKHIAKNQMSHRITPLAIALGNQDAAAAMSFPTPDADNQGLGSLANPRPDQHSQSVKLLTLDTFIAQNPLSRLDFIKLDIQGGEFNFLLGAQKTLCQFRPEIIMEISPADLAPLGKTSRDLLTLVESLGYTIHQIQNNSPGPRLSPATTPKSFAATNVFCLPQ